MNGRSDLLNKSAALLIRETAEIITGPRLPIRPGEPDLSPYPCDLPLLPGIKFSDLGDVPSTTAQFQAPYSVRPASCQDRNAASLHVHLQQVSCRAGGVLVRPLVKAIHDQQQPVVSERLLHQRP